MAGNRNSIPPPEEKAVRGRFEKGKSGNPGGRPKWVVNLKDLCAKHTEEAVEVLLDVMRNARLDKDRSVAAQYLLDRAHGKPVQAISNDPDNPLPVTGLIVQFVKPEPDRSISGQA